MEATTQNQDVPAAPRAARRPLKVFRFEDVSVSIFANEHQLDGVPRTFYNVSMSRTYKKEGVYRRTQSFGSEDLGTLMDLLKQASDFIMSLEEPEPTPE